MNITLNSSEKERKTLEVPKGLGEVMGTVLRQAAMVETPSWRPIGFVLEEGNMVTSSDHIVQDMISVSAILASSQFGGDAKEGHTEVHTVFRKECNLSDICDNGISLLSENKVLVSSLKDTAIPIHVIFRYGKGNYSISDNKRYLVENVSGGDAFVVLSSRHTPITRFKSTVKSSAHTDIIDIDYTTNNKDNSIIERTIDLLITTLTNIR